MAVQLDAQFDDNPFTKNTHPEALPEGEDGVQHSQAKQEENNGMQCRGVSRHNAIDDGAYKCGIGQIECTGHKGSPHQQPKLPPVGPGETEQAQHTLTIGLDFLRQSALIFSQTCIGVWRWIAKHVFLPILSQMKISQEVLKRNLRLKRRRVSQLGDCPSSIDV